MSAQKVGKTLRLVELLKFGMAQDVTPLMECKLSSDADMALNALAQEDASDPVWLGYNLSQFHVTRHGAKTSAVVWQRSREAPHRLVDLATK